MKTVTVNPWYDLPTNYLSSVSSCLASYSNIIHVVHTYMIGNTGWGIGKNTAATDRKAFQVFIHNK